jgi:hypothetical protein
MVGDLIAKKRKFYFSYEVLTAVDLDHILELLWDAPGLFFMLRYKENNVVKTARVYVGSIPTELHRGEKNSNWVWKNVTFDLIEQ